MYFLFVLAMVLFDINCRFVEALNISDTELTANQTFALNASLETLFLSNVTVRSGVYIEVQPMCSTSSCGLNSSGPFTVSIVGCRWNDASSLVITGYLAVPTRAASVTIANNTLSFVAVTGKFLSVSILFKNNTLIHLLYYNVPVMPPLPVSVSSAAKACAVFDKVELYSRSFVTFLSNDLAGCTGVFPSGATPLAITVQSTSRIMQFSQLSIDSNTGISSMSIGCMSTQVVDGNSSFSIRSNIVSPTAFTAGIFFENCDTVSLIQVSNSASFEVCANVIIGHIQYGIRLTRGTSCGGCSARLTVQNASVFQVSRNYIRGAYWYSVMFSFTTTTNVVSVVIDNKSRMNIENNIIRRRPGYDYGCTTPVYFGLTQVSSTAASLTVSQDSAMSISFNDVASTCSVGIDVQVFPGAVSLKSKGYLQVSDNVISVNGTAISLKVQSLQLSDYSEYTVAKNLIYYWPNLSSGATNAVTIQGRSSGVGATITSAASCRVFVRRNVFLLPNKIGHVLFVFAVSSFVGNGIVAVQDNSIGNANFTNRSAVPGVRFVMTVTGFSNTGFVVLPPVLQLSGNSFTEIAENVSWIYTNVTSLLPVTPVGVRFYCNRVNGTIDRTIDSLLPWMNQSISFVAPYNCPTETWSAETTSSRSESKSGESPSSTVSGSWEPSFSLSPSPTVTASHSDSISESSTWSPSLTTTMSKLSSAVSHSESLTSERSFSLSVTTTSSFSFGNSVSSSFSLSPTVAASHSDSTSESSTWSPSLTTTMSKLSSAVSHSESLTSERSFSVSVYNTPSVSSDPSVSRSFSLSASASFTYSDSTSESSSRSSTPTHTRSLHSGTISATATVTPPPTPSSTKSASFTLTSSCPAQPTSVERGATLKLSSANMQTFATGNIIPVLVLAVEQKISLNLAALTGVQLTSAENISANVGEPSSWVAQIFRNDSSSAVQISGRMTSRTISQLTLVKEFNISIRLHVTAIGDCMPPNFHEEVNVMWTVTPLPAKSPIEQAAVAIFRASTTTASCLGNPVASLTTTTMVSIASLDDCLYSDVDPLDSSVSPTGLAAEYDGVEGQYYRGAVITALSLFGAVTLAATGIAFIRKKSHPLPSSLAAHFATLRMPSTGMVLVGLFAQGLASCSVSLIRLNSSHRDVLLGVAGLFTCSLIAGLSLYVTTIGFQCEMERRSEDLSNKEEASDIPNKSLINMVKSRFHDLTAWKNRWKDVSGNHFKKRYFSLMDDLKLPWWTGVELSSALIQGAILGIRANAASVCQAQKIVILFHCVLVMVGTLYLRPCGAWVSNLFLILSKVGATSVAVFVALHTITQNDLFSSITDDINFAFTVVAMFQTVLQVLITIAGLTSVISPLKQKISGMLAGKGRLLHVDSEDDNEVSLAHRRTKSTVEIHQLRRVRYEALMKTFQLEMRKGLLLARLETILHPRNDRDKKQLVDDVENTLHVLVELSCMSRVVAECIMQEVLHSRGLPSSVCPM